MNLPALDTYCNLCMQITPDICNCFIFKVPLTLKSLLTASLHNKDMWPTEWCQLHSAPVGDFASFSSKKKYIYRILRFWADGAQWDVASESYSKLRRHWRRNMYFWMLLLLLVAQSAKCLDQICHFYPSKSFPPGIGRVLWIDGV